MEIEGLITAQEAKAITDKNLEDHTEEDLIECDKAIREACVEGKCMAIISHRISMSAAFQLRKVGYEVSRLGPQTNIMWYLRD